MQYRYEFGHAVANVAFAKGRTALVIRKRSEVVWVYKWGTLSLTSPSHLEGLYSSKWFAPM